MPHTLLWADRARELNPKLRQGMRVWGNQTHGGLWSHKCCSCVDHFLILTLRWAGPTHPQGPTESLVCIFQNKKLKSSNLPRFCQCMAPGDLSCQRDVAFDHDCLNQSLGRSSHHGVKALAKPQVIPCCRWGLTVLWQPSGSLIPQNASDMKFYIRCSLLNVLSYSKAISAMICQATAQSYCDMHL